MSSTATSEKAQFIVSVAEDEAIESKSSRSSNEYCKCNLVDYHSLPDFLKHNKFVINHYRSEWPLKQTVLSIFSFHNETLNIWTHLIGFFIFFALAITMIVAMGKAEFLKETSQHIARWPFYAYLFGAMFCLLVSSACHLLSCHSEHTCYIMCRLDYAGISALIVTSFYPLVYYTFVCEPFYRNLYMSFITLFGVASIIVSLMKIFEKPEYTMVRAGLFACMGMSGLVPIMHKMYAFGDREEAVITTMYEVLMLCFYGFGVVVYVFRIPERWFPGKFDLVGHSHQLWHVLVFAGAYTHYLSGLVYLSWRDAEGC